MNTDKAHAPTTTGSTTQPNPRIQTVLAAPKGRRFNRARPYARTPAPAERRPAPVERLPEDGARDERALPPWLLRVHTELAPQEPNPASPRPSSEVRGPLPRQGTPVRLAPAAKKRKRLFSRGRLRRPRALDESARRWENTRHACTVLGMLLTAYAIGLIG
ncbi:hypothetical protein O4J56_02710 [Nocardiopsis sp. RSe5-2]|uniref:Uncharacterized protein n=1 Tax=Nocardiopsis endophytica TaxID=3018445 RepID=A0ABT4TZ78_9ACTN|nr:hypothetical protein [Nocardiopsis endophytica]MDA2809540.1 hypothetical protein [Nocardiopsis endophytica]